MLKNLLTQLPTKPEKGNKQTALTSTSHDQQLSAFEPV